MLSLNQIPGWIARRNGRQRLALAVLAGALSALGFAPIGLFWLLLAGFGGLVLLLDAAGTEVKPLRRAALYGWGFGFGQCAVGLHWIGFAFMVDAADHAWQLPFVAVLFPGGLALFTAAATAVAARLWRPGPVRVFVFALAYGLSEWLRGHILTGFPWNIAAYGWGAVPAVMQSAALFGSYGLSLLTVLFGASLALLTEEKRWRMPAVLAGLFVLLFVWGGVRLASVHPADVAGVRLRLVQPAIPQAEKFRRDLVPRNWQRLVDLSTAPGADGKAPSVVIWPEAALPFLYTPDGLGMEWIADLNARRPNARLPNAGFSDAHGAVLMTGAVRADFSGDKPVYYNSFLVFAGARQVAVYDKSHLVPFGEYLPFEETLNALGLQKLTGIAGSFGRGDGPQSLAVPGLPSVGPLICYEILFPGAVVGEVRPDWFANVTDDSWFGPWAGPRQHLLVAQMRAIEEGVPVVRVANTGISAVIDPQGRITTKSKLNVSTYIDSGLPNRLPPTLYSFFRHGWFWAILSALLIVTAIIYRRK